MAAKTNHSLGKTQVAISSLGWVNAVLTDLEDFCRKNNFPHTAEKVVDAKVSFASEKNLLKN